MDKSITSDQLMELIDKLSDEVKRNGKIGTGSSLLSLLGAVLLSSSIQSLVGTGIATFGVGTLISGGVAGLGAGIATVYFLNKLKNEKAIKNLVKLLEDSSNDKEKIESLKKEIALMNKKYIDFSEIEGLLNKYKE